MWGEERHRRLYDVEYVDTWGTEGKVMGERRTEIATCLTINGMKAGLGRCVP